MPDQPRPPEPRVIDTADPEKLRAVAAEFGCGPEAVAEAIAKVGNNRTAVELYLSAPEA